MNHTYINKQSNSKVLFIMIRLLNCIYSTLRHCKSALLQNAICPLKLNDMFDNSFKKDDPDCDSD